MTHSPKPGGQEDLFTISPRGALVVSPRAAARLLRDNGTLDSARKHMKFYPVRPLKTNRSAR